MYIRYIGQYDQNWQQTSFSSDGVVTNRWLAIVWTNDGIFFWRIYDSPDLDGLISRNVQQCSDYAHGK